MTHLPPGEIELAADDPNSVGVLVPPDQFHDKLSQFLRPTDTRQIDKHLFLVLPNHSQSCMMSLKIGPST